MDKPFTTTLSTTYMRMTLKFSTLLPQRIAFAMPKPSYRTRKQEEIKPPLRYRVAMAHHPRDSSHRARSYTVEEAPPRRRVDRRPP